MYVFYHYLSIIYPCECPAKPASKFYRNKNRNQSSKQSETIRSLSVNVQILILEKTGKYLSAGANGCIPEAEFLNEI